MKMNPVLVNGKPQAYRLCDWTGISCHDCPFQTMANCPVYFTKEDAMDDIKSIAKKIQKVLEKN